MGLRRSHRDMILSVVALLLLLACCSQPAAALEVPEDKFIGWAGETYKPGSAQAQPWIEVVSWKPRAFVAHGFLSKDEARHLRKLSAVTLRRSTVISHSGKSVEDSYRTSYGTFLKRLSDPVVAAVDARVADWARVPVVNGEDMQILRYDVGQEYKKHFDGLMDDKAGPRVATVLLYLSDVEEGGETAFPDSTHWAHPDQASRGGPFSSCTEGGVAFKPKLGDALLFWSIKPDGKTLDVSSMHTGCPVLQGVKWTATKWIHAKAFRPDEFEKSGRLLGVNVTEKVADPGNCEDSHESCEGWAEAGECANNAAYMVGDIGSLGACRRACGKCKPCPKGDMVCYNKNREELGYLVLKDVTEQSEWLF
ncbi:MAG: hypothetical protein J3K34DRAFT_404626 [Monoraphidium minutum]|nr:MAG: hypothetical protein J3K34DRAFT_404626 [Monoraphidium minutum]